MFGTDICLPQEREWFKISNPVLQDRLKILSDIRLEVLFRANEMADHRIEVENLNRIQKLFKVGDLILIRLGEKQRRMMVRTEENRKLYPLWSVPYRVINVKSKGKAALCRSLLTNELHEVHLQNARFILSPQSIRQRDQWEEEISDLVTFMSEDQRRQALDRFWKSIDEIDDVYVDIPAEMEDEDVNMDN